MGAVRQDQNLVEHLVVLRAQLGDRDAFVRLHERHNVRLLYYLRRLLSPAHHAEDVLQEVWVTVVRKIATLEQPQAFKVWLYRIAHNRAVSRLRRERRHVPLDELPEELEIDPASSQDDDRAPFARFDTQAIHSGLERLSTPHREVLTLRFLDELSYEQIAEITGCNLGTVRSRIHYAKKALHGHLVAASP